MQTLIQQVKMSLDQNQTLNESAKESIFFMVQKIYQKMSSMGISFPKDLLIERLKSVSIEEGKKLLDREVYHYNIEKNTLIFNLDKISEQNQENVFCQALFAMSSIQNPKISNRGIDGNQFAALAKGTFEIFANHIAPNHGEISSYEDEQVIANLMNDLSDGNLLESFLQMDNKMLEDTINRYQLFIVNDYANYNLIARPAGCKSQLGGIQIFMIKEVFRKSPIEIINQISAFESHLVTTPSIMSNPKQYADLNEVKQIFKFKQQYGNQHFDMNNVIQMSKPIHHFSTETSTETYQEEIPKII